MLVTPSGLTGPARARSARALLLLVTLILCACGGDRADRARGGAAWRRIQTEHIELTTDLGERDAFAAAEALERTRAALLSAAWSKLTGTRQTERLHVVVLAEERAFHRYFGPHTTGFYTPIGGGTVVLTGTPSHWEKRPLLKVDVTTSVLRHEMTHHLAAGIYGRQPRWFAEGLAQFLETIAVREDGTKATLGLPNPVAMQSYRRVRSLGVKDALAWGGPKREANQREVAGLYGLSWVMISWMFNTQRAAFDAYQGMLARGEDPQVAWDAAFGSMAVEDIDKELFQYAQHGTAQVYEIELPRIEVQRVAVPLGAADVHVILAELSLVQDGRENKRGGPAAEEAEREIFAALELEPGHPGALALSALTPHPMSRSDIAARLRERTQARPDDGEAWLALGERSNKPDEKEAALRKAVALLPGKARAYNDLAWYLVQTKRAEEALPLATKASLRAPWNPAVLDTYAACLFAVGRCPDALAVQRRAVDNLPERVKDHGGAPEYTRALARYEEACGAKVER